MSEWTGTKSGGFQWNSSTGFAVGNDWTISVSTILPATVAMTSCGGEQSCRMVPEWASVDNGGAGSSAWKVDYNLPTTQQFQTIRVFGPQWSTDVMWRTTD